MKRAIVVTTMLLAVLGATRVLAANSISLELWEPWMCEAEHRLGIHITNDVPLKSLTVPLIVRGYGAASVTSVKLSYGQRLSGTALADMRQTNLYFAEDGACKSGQPGGFSTVTFSDTLTHAAPGTPFGMMFHFATLGTDYLPAGQDSYSDPSTPYLAGSLFMTFTFDNLWAQLDIDTTCTSPANHVLFVDASDQAIVPGVAIGHVIVDWFCIGHGDLDLDGFITAVDLGREIDYLFAGGSIQTDHGCEGLVDGGDFNCDGFPDAIDLAQYIDHLFAGGDGPCDPVFDCAPCKCAGWP